MLNRSSFVIFVLATLAFFSSCHKDVGEINPQSESTIDITTPLVFEEIEGDLIGYLYDIENNPIADAEVSIYSGKTTTNEFGIFKFQDAKMDIQGTLIKVQKPGYLIGSDFVYPSSKGNATSKILMLKSDNMKSFNALQGGSIELVNGGQINFSPSSIAHNNGSSFVGEVQVSVYTVFPDDIEMGDMMPGGLLGFDEKGRHRVLASFGVLTLELRSESGAKLKLKSNQQAQLSFPIDAGLLGNAPAEIELWKFSFSEGLWIQNAYAKRDGSFYKVDLSDMGFWTIAEPFGLAQVCGRLLNTSQLPAVGYQIQVLVNGLPARIGLTDKDGYFCGKLPMEENVEFQIFHPTCNTLVKKFEAGPFGSVENIGVIEIASNEDYQSGSIECNGEPYTNAIVILEVQGRKNFVFPNGSGQFELDRTDLFCGSNNTASVYAFDFSTNVASEIYALTTDYQGEVILDVCSLNCDFEVELLLEKENYCVSGGFEVVTAVPLNGTGEYSYLWENGSTNSFLQNPVIGSTVCVLVTDNNSGCSSTTCVEVPYYFRLDIASIESYNEECQVNSGIIGMNIVGGRDEISYHWTGPNGYTSSVKEPENLAPGLYEVVAIDEFGCEAESSVAVFDVTTPVKSSKEDFCDLSIITIEEDEGYKPYSYNWSAGSAVGNQLFVYSPGVYALTVTDANECTRRKVLTISKVGALPIINTDFECLGKVVRFNELESGFDYFYQVSGSPELTFVNFVNGHVDVPILKSGYTYNIGSENPSFGDCMTSESVVLPKFEGLAIDEVKNTSCGSCDDGQIFINLDIEANCTDGCVAGNVIVLEKDSEEEVTGLNDQGALASGEYYVVVLDENNGCYIAHELVIVE